MLLERDDPEGISHIESAMDNEPDSIAAGCELIYSFLRRQGRKEEAEKYRTRLFRHYDVLEHAGQERATFNDGDVLLPHGLSPEQIARLREQVRRYYLEIKRAYLARKQIANLPDKPLYVLGIETESSWYESKSDEADMELLNKLLANISFDGETYIIIFNRSFKKTKKAMSALDGALIYGE